MNQGFRYTWILSLIQTLGKRTTGGKKQGCLSANSYWVENEKVAYVFTDCRCSSLCDLNPGDCNHNLPNKWLRSEMHLQ